jgi:S-adenosyl methyltransferase
VLHFIPDADDPYAIVAQLRDAVIAGSYIAVSHVTQVAEQAEGQETVRQLLSRTATPGYYRTREQIVRLLTGLDIVEPGIVAVSDWHPDPSEGSEPWPGLLAAIGRKP